MIIETFTSEETKKAGFELAVNAKPADIYCLVGDLGVGKTVFTKGFAKGLGINETIISPTFTIINEYKIKNINFYHFDVYRLKSEEDLYDLGYEEYFYGNGICLIEWADVVKDLIPDNAVWINIKKDLSKGEDYRIIEVLK